MRKVKKKWNEKNILAVGFAAIAVVTLVSLIYPLLGTDLAGKAWSTQSSEDLLVFVDDCISGSGCTLTDPVTGQDTEATDLKSKASAIHAKFLELGAPAVSFAYGVSGGSSNINNYITTDTLQFVATTANPTGLEYEWDFGDSSSHATGQSATHRFTQAGTYRVSMTVRETGTSFESQAFEDITVRENQPPVANFAYRVGGGPDSGSSNFAHPAEGETVTFTASASDERHVADYFWEVFTDQSQTRIADARGSSFNHVFTAPGFYYVKLHATDSGGAIGWIQKHIYIKPKLVDSIKITPRDDLDCGTGWEKASDINDNNQQPTQALCVKKSAMEAFEGVEPGQQDGSCLRGEAQEGRFNDRGYYGRWYTTDTFALCAIRNTYREPTAVSDLKVSSSCEADYQNNHDWRDLAYNSIETSKELCVRFANVRPTLDNPTNGVILPHGTSGGSSGGTGTSGGSGGTGGTTCIPETHTEFCSRLGESTGDVTALDNCGVSRSVNCASFPAGGTGTSGGSGSGGVPGSTGYTLTVNINPASGGRVNLINELNSQDTFIGLEGQQVVTKTYLVNTPVLIVAVYSTGYTFGSWVGANPVSTGFGRVTMDSDKTVTANFALSTGTGTSGTTGDSGSGGTTTGGSGTSGTGSSLACVPPDSGRSPETGSAFRESISCSGSICTSTTDVDLSWQRCTGGVYYQVDIGCDCNDVTGTSCSDKPKNGVSSWIPSSANNQMIATFDLSNINSQTCWRVRSKNSNGEVSNWNSGFTLIREILPDE